MGNPEPDELSAALIVIASMSAELAAKEAELAAIDRVTALGFAPIYLDDLSGDGSSDRGDGVIVRLPTGVRWTRQAGGSACAHPIIEGLFLPLPVADLLPFAYQCIPDWCLRKSDTAMLDEIDRQLIAANYLLLVDREALERSPVDCYGEAWLPVKIQPITSQCFIGLNPTLALKPFAGMTGVLTWPNSD